MNYRNNNWHQLKQLQQVQEQNSRYTPSVGFFAMENEYMRFATSARVAIVGGIHQGSRAFRHELYLRILRHKFNPEKPYEPLRDGTSDGKVCEECVTWQRSMKKCSGCRWAYYCSPACQLRHWHLHKPNCNPDLLSIRTGITYHTIRDTAASSDQTTF